MKIQTTVIQQNLKSQKDIKGLIDSMKPEIAGILGPQIQQDISKGFLVNISGLTELIETKFKQLEEKNQQKHDTVINAISNDKINRILQLETELKAKDDMILELNSKDSEAKGKLIGKEEVIQNLKSNIEQLKHQLDSLSFAKDTCINQLESIIKKRDEIIARLNAALQLKDTQSIIPSNQLQRKNQILTANDK